MASDRSTADRQELEQRPPGERAGVFWAAAQTRLETVACCCSVYDECWVADSRRDEPEPMGECPADPPAAFRE